MKLLISFLFVCSASIKSAVTQLSKTEYRFRGKKESNKEYGGLMSPGQQEYSLPFQFNQPIKHDREPGIIEGSARSGNKQSRASSCGISTMKKAVILMCPNILASTFTNSRY
jgi:hypothetical protein